MKFSELEKMADSIAVRIGEAVNIGVSYWHHKSGTKEREYKFYKESAPNTIAFSSVLALKSHMENILNPIEDEGVELE